MTTEQKIKEFQGRKAHWNAAEQEKRLRMFERFSVINRFEGITPGRTERELFELLSSGKITEKEFLDLCTADAQAHQ
jgi:hypothetical protein